jgi:drug/metabolite transporter (DMT)-like permease
VRELPPLTIALGRVAIAAAALWAVMALLRIPMPRALPAWRAFAVMGLLNNAVPFGLYAWGQQHIASGLAAILNATTPLFTVVFAHWLTADEKLGVRRFVGVLVGIAGVGWMLGVERFAASDTALLAQGACLAAAISYAFAGIYGRRFRTMGVPPLASATGQVTASSLLLLPLAMALETPWRLAAPGPATVGALAGIGLLSTALAYQLYFRLLARAGATNVILVTLLIPVSAIVLGALFLGESLHVRHYLGMATIAAALLLIDGRLVRLPRTRRHRVG